MDQNQNNISVKAVIRGLECCQECNGYTCRNFCPYHDMDQVEGQSTCMCHLAGDALTLLKERECATVEPKRPELSDETRACLDKMDTELLRTGGEVGMTVKEALEHLDAARIEWNEGYAYQKPRFEALDMAIDALKAQEPKLVHVTADINHRKIGECPTCGKWINSGDYPNYCGHCGRAVKWE